MTSWAVSVSSQTQMFSGRTSPAARTRSSSRRSRAAASRSAKGGVFQGFAAGEHPPAQRADFRVRVFAEAAAYVLRLSLADGGGHSAGCFLRCR